MSQPADQQLASQVGHASACQTPAPSEIVALGLRTLDHPEIAEEAVALAESVLDGWGAGRDSAEQLRCALLLLAMAGYVRAEVIGARPLGKLIPVLSLGAPPVCVLAGELLKAALAGPCADAAIRLVLSALAKPGKPALFYEVLIECLEFATRWASVALRGHDLVALFELPDLHVHRRRLMRRSVEEWLYAAGQPDSLAALDRLAGLCGDLPDFKYFLYFTARRQSLPGDVRIRAGELAAGRFPLHASVGRCLGEGEQHVLIVQNLSAGQGDEIIRCVPLIQALVDFNARLEITLVTNRAYLHAHPRVTTVAFGDTEGIQAILNNRYAAVIDFFESNSRDANYNPDIESQLQEHIRTHPAKLVLASAKTPHRFVFDVVRLEGRDYAAELGLDQQRINNVYEPTLRLLAELGLPVRLGEDRSASEWVLTGEPWPLAETEWQRVTQNNIENRPVALLNPFGGGTPLKGYLGSQLDALAAQLRRLTDAGFFVVLTPSAKPWGARSRAHQLIERLEPQEQKLCAIAPDAGGQTGEDADTVMRMQLYFIRFADLVVAVEGWMIHAAYCLGKPYRTLMLPQSIPGWHPFVQAHDQRIEQPPPEWIPEDARVCLAEQPRKFRLITLLKELGQCEETQALPFIQRALRSLDHHVRHGAAQALAKLHGPEVDRLLIELLQDSFCQVRATSAEALLRGSTAAPREQLSAHVSIARPNRNWLSILQIGESVQTAVGAAALDDDPVVRREAGRALLYFSNRSPGEEQRDSVLILTPVKDAADCLETYFEQLSRLTYPHRRISLGFLESDSTDGTHADLKRRIPGLQSKFRRAGLWKKDFGYRIPDGLPRWTESIQAERRMVLAKSRNHLLMHALDDEAWVLWLDVDVAEYPADIIERLLAAGKDIVQPHCVLQYGGRTFDQNAWRDHGRRHMDDLRGMGLVRLDAVGGTMLLVRADLHRDGLIFPSFPYGRGNERVRPQGAELETEGLGIMAGDMGRQCWGMPDVEILHRWK